MQLKWVYFSAENKKSFPFPADRGPIHNQEGEGNVIPGTLITHHSWHHFFIDTSAAGGANHGSPHVHINDRQKRG